MLVVGISPGVVEHVFAVGVVFHVQRTGRRQGLVLPKRDKARRPAGVGCGATAAVQGGQVGVLHERRGRVLLGTQGVPSEGGELERVVEHANDIIHLLF